MSYEGLQKVLEAAFRYMTDKSGNHMLAQRDFQDVLIEHGHEAMQDWDDVLPVLEMMRDAHDTVANWRQTA